MLQARAATNSGFTYGRIMIDKARAEMAAVRLLELEDLALGFLLCYFHFLQDWERFLRSAESGIPSADKELRHCIMLSLAALANVRDEKLFQEKVGNMTGIWSMPDAGCLGIASHSWPHHALCSMSRVNAHHSSPAAPANACS